MRKKVESKEQIVCFMVKIIGKKIKVNFEDILKAVEGEEVRRFEYKEY